MKDRVSRFKSLAIALKELEPFVRDGAHLRHGRPFSQMEGMRSREALANWLICAALNGAGSANLIFTSDPTGGDGFIVEETTGKSWPTEHVMVAAAKGGNIEPAILKAIELKIAKGGAAYATGKNLVVFVDAEGGLWFPNRVAKALPLKLHFASAWVVALQSAKDGTYRYGVTSLALDGGNAPVFMVQIAPGFDAWQVTALQ